MTPRIQGLLLRFLDSSELKKIRADRPVRRADVRVIAATNRNLRGLVAKGVFLKELFHRINMIQLAVPSLRDRREDIPLLIEHFLARAARNNVHGLRHIAPAALACLCEYAWPGNLAELESVIERLVVTVSGKCARVEDLPAEIRWHRHAIFPRPKPDRRRTPRSTFSNVSVLRRQRKTGLHDTLP
jgi:DNA-binding NtrC family response regulator